MTIRKTGGNEKPWGTEIIWASNDKYCGKILMFKDAGSKTAIQFHKEKHKCWFVNEGTFCVRWVETETGNAKENIIQQGGVIEVPPLRPFQMEALLPNSVLLEVGTAELENDISLLSVEETVGSPQPVP